MKVAAAGVVTHWRQQGKWWRCDQPRHVCYDLHIILFVVCEANLYVQVLMLCVGSFIS